MAEDGVDGIKGVGANHTNLVDDQQFQFLQQFALGAAQADIAKEAMRVRGGDVRRGCGEVWLRSGKVRSEGQLKKRMECCSTRVDRGDAGGCGDSQFLERVVADEFEKGCFAGPCFPGKKDGSGGLIDKLYRQF